MSDQPPSYDDAQLARAVADAAGQVLLAIQSSGLWAGKAMGETGDGVSNAIILSALRAHRPDDPVLSEEEADGQARLGARRVWIVDPLDGTREFADGRTDWAVHVALAVDGRPVAGAVSLPGLHRTFDSAALSLPSSRCERLRVVVSRTRPARQAVALAERIKAELLPMGSAGAKAMAVVCGEADIYLHSGGQYEWDSCAPVAVAEAVGLHASRLDGSALTYNSPDPYLPDLLICRKELASELLATLASLPGEWGPAGVHVAEGSLSDNVKAAPP